MTSGADIQVENGNWAKVHNLILKALAKVDLTGREAKCLFFLLSMTYGKQEKEHEISLTLWAEGTGIDKRHVKPIIDRLIDRHIVNRIDGAKGRGHTAVYGFNKYFEQWDSKEKVPSTAPIVEEKVPPEAPIEKVLDTVPFGDFGFDEKVPSTVPEKVPSTVPTKERESKQLAANDSDDTIILIREAYQAVCRIGPPMREESGRSNMIIASSLIEHFGFEACLRGLATLRERNNALIVKSKRKQGILAPLPYLKTIMEGDDATPFVAPATVDFALEDLSQ